MMKIPWQGILGNPPFQTVAGEQMDRFWERAWSDWLILWLAVLAALVAVAWYVVAQIRSEPAKKEHQASQWLTKYTELHSRGGLSDEEFRTIKTKLAERLQDELNDNGENG